MRKVCILFPRLDVTFKEGFVPETRGEIPPIRVHWQNMCNYLIQMHRSDSVAVIEKPLWQFTTEFVESLDADIIYVPHKSTDTFPVREKNIFYYMQSVFPWQFYIDTKGFAGGASFYPLDIDKDRTIPSDSFYAQMQNRAKLGESKFSQPPSQILYLPKEFFFFPCQIPHDETIKYHSDISVLDSLVATCKATEKLNVPLIVKGHPVNPGSMKSLHQAASKFKHVIWLDNVSIHDILPQAIAVVVVNSGVGMETLLHKTPVVTFGRAEYDCVANPATVNNIVDVLQNLKFDKKKVEAFFQTWYEITHDTRIINIQNNPLLLSETSV